MNKLMTYLGYSASVRFDAEDEVFVGRVLGLNDIVGFHAESVQELKSAFAEAVDDYLQACERAGKQPEKSYSGNLMLRVDPNLHAAAVRAAEASGESLSEWARNALENAVGIVGDTKLPPRLTPQDRRLLASAKRTRFNERKQAKPTPRRPTVMH